ncbi:MAG: ferritin-like domain-containing protein [Candidatus Caenarcaniphilales bacterium]|nr:ferritin-like domain-containing protein [Candidatus Caenarcaniphilales bacterium]
MKELNTKANFNLPDRSSDDDFHKVLHSHKSFVHLKKKKSAAENQSTKSHIYWGAQHFNLHHSKLFSSMSTLQKENILASCSSNLLNEAYFIEKAGIKFSAKMIVNSEFTEDAQFYSLMASDEACHLEILKNRISKNINYLNQSPFLLLLHQIIEELEPQKLLYLVQIILEGWGLNHYLQLSKGCQDKELKEDFQKILKDEAIHTISGKSLLRPASFSLKHKADLIDKLSAYASMVRVGELSLLNTIHREFGELKGKAKIEILEEIDNQNTTKTKLRLLMNLANQPGMEEIVQAVFDKNLFEPCSNQETAKLLDR